jgi:hypothetical protein
VPCDDWEAASAAVKNGSLKASRKMNKSFEVLCHFPLLWVLCNLLPTSKFLEWFARVAYSFPLQKYFVSTDVWRHFCTRKNLFLFFFAKGKKLSSGGVVDACRSAQIIPQADH